MAKSIRSKREKRLRAIRRELVQPLYDQKEAAKLAALDAALNAPKLPVKPYTSSSSSSSSSASSMDVNTTSSNTASDANAKPDRDMDVEMADDTHTKNFLKPVGKKLKMKFKLARNKRRGKGHIKKRHI